MYKSLKDRLEDFALHLDWLLEAFASFLPFFVLIFALSGLSAYAVSRKGGGDPEYNYGVLFAQFFFAALFGLVVGYVQQRVESVLSAILPNFLLVVAVLLQAIGRLSKNLDVPIQSDKAFTSVTLCLVMFLLSSKAFLQDGSIGPSPPPMDERSENVPEPAGG